MKVSTIAELAVRWFRNSLRPDLDVRVIINFSKTIYSMAQNRESFIGDVLETNIDLIFDCIYRFCNNK